MRAEHSALTGKVKRPHRNNPQRLMQGTYVIRQINAPVPMDHSSSARSAYCLTFICLLLSIFEQKKTAIAPMSNYGFVLVLIWIPVLLSLAEGAMTPFLSPFLPNLLRPNLLRPEIQPHSTIPPPACIVGVFPYCPREYSVNSAGRRGKGQACIS